MVRYHPSIWKRRSHEAPGKVDRTWLPRIIFQSAKRCARKAVPTAVLSRLGSHMGEDALSLHPYPHQKPIEPLPPTPLVHPKRWRSLPKSFVKPEMPKIDPARIAIAQPGYAGVPPADVRDGWYFMGYKPLGLYQKLYVDPPKPALNGLGMYNVLMKDLGLVSSATHVFGVYLRMPGWLVRDPVWRQVRTGFRCRRPVLLYPTHSAIWAAHCSRLPPMPPAETRPLKSFRRATDTTQPAWCLRLPIVQVPLPYPPKFFVLMMFVYTHLKCVFIAHLLPCAANSKPMPEDGKVGDECYWTMVHNIAAEYKDMPTVLRLAKNVFGTYQNMCALGMVDDKAWEALNIAWRMVLDVMEILDARQSSESSA
ncbi:hypothetical protein BD309DRAFT_731329 [Dichomitus squalens]|uniref:Uncharacterized protein n=2 Tax=Dichomitus squalens TaxID=114155 RepID=A0A4Q9PVE1_9APHY|nr:uncharacterized protein DICSQDRAFT_183659 [Dichomitus squalens LYAD-421 SS1]EJF56699.1 hypothetical protein DICSQDRAFT_183659 [Dichomitus squalens LYAD-421 SS1]TBU45328.1 hypothetical protein BD309DRAFT_731329 [Dichomitus squalens]TBU58531.1 hypothetical protein BD310DRAFT_926808 [Dichomitus squalens]